MENSVPTRLILDDLAEIVAIPSVYSAPEDGAPYGKDCRRAIEWFVSKARSYGLPAVNVDNYAAYAEIGEGKECVGVLAHLDVVPAGGGWATDPFKMIEENGKVYGRGVGDDKGSVVVCLHALKAIKDSGIKLKRRIRLIVGADEERGSSCIRYYLNHGGEVPAMSFVPDSEFPVINSEKGISHIKFEFEDSKLTSNISYIDGAECLNAVPDSSTVKIVKGSPLEAALKELCGGSVTDDIFKKAPAVNAIITAGNSIKDYSVTVSDCITVCAKGTAEHASTPEKGDSALWKTLVFLAAFNDKIGSPYLEKAVDCLCTPLASGKLGIYVDDEKSGDLTMCMSEAGIENGKLWLAVDFRLPLGVKPQTVADKICARLGCKATVLDYHENLYIDPDAPLIKTLLSVYREVTGDMTAPLKTGGGTYARELPNAVAFGCTPVDLDINMHRADENFPVAQLFKNYDIYLAAMVKLANL
ncbi:MAG: Sapep family Mn(2+)-dependent dipeptidase [Clostridiales bacterium]|nr:Sapep family Mn(2+)-dependent dipeptidase [Clostridiales bacterium]